MGAKLAAGDAMYIICMYGSARHVASNIDEKGRGGQGPSCIDSRHGSTAKGTGCPVSKPDGQASHFIGCNGVFRHT